MIKKVTLTNNVTKQGIVINATDGAFIIDEIDWDSPSVEMSTYRVPYQIGYSYAGLTVGTRKPSITGYVVAHGVETSEIWEQYWKDCETYVEDKKEELDRIISIYQDITIEVNGYYLDVRPTVPPKYSNSYKENNEVLCRFSLEFECFNPMFYKETKEVNFSSVENDFKFPLVIPQSKGVLFGVEQRRKIILFENGGDVPVGCYIRMRAVSEGIRMVQINSVTEAEGISFETITMAAGDEIRINTNIGEESVMYYDFAEDKEKSIVGQISVGSKLFKILVGKNYYTYNTEPESELLDVTVTYKEQYFNIRGM